MKKKQLKKNKKEVEKMKKFASILVIIGMMLSISVVFAARDVQVDGYYKDNGTYVESHHRSSPDDRIDNNYDYPGNTNPYK